MRLAERALSKLVKTRLSTARLCRMTLCHDCLRLSRFWLHNNMLRLKTKTGEWSHQTNAKIVGGSAHGRYLKISISRAAVSPQTFPNAFGGRLIPETLGEVERSLQQKKWDEKKGEGGRKSKERGQRIKWEMKKGYKGIFIPYANYRWLVSEKKLRNKLYIKSYRNTFQIRLYFLLQNTRRLYTDTYICVYSHYTVLWHKTYRPVTVDINVNWRFISTNVSVCIIGE